MLLTRLLQGAWPAVLAGALGLPPAHADIYTWVDASGAVNVSNLTPPEGVQVTRIDRASAPKTVAPEAAARDAVLLANVKVLEQEVQQLQDEVALARRPAAAQLVYPPMPAPPIMQYALDQAPPPALYAANAAQPYGPGCDFAWGNCGFWGGSLFYPTSIIVLHSGRAHHFAHFHGGHPMVERAPVRALSTPVRAFGRFARR